LKSLFPNISIDFDPVIDQGDSIPQSTDNGADVVSNLEKFLRREVPRIFQTLLEETRQLQPKNYEENQSGEQLMELVERAQNQAFKNYAHKMTNSSSSDTVPQVPASHRSATHAIGQQTSSQRDLLGSSHSVQRSSGQKFGSTSSTSSRSTIRSQPVSTTSRDASLVSASHPILLPASPQSFTTPYAPSAPDETRRVVGIGRSDEESTA
jgi:hypothetical protein